MAMRIFTMAAALAAAIVAGCSGPTPDALVASGKDYLAKNDRHAAVIQFKNALQQNPNLAEARFLLGRSLLDAGDFAAAEKELRKAKEFNYPAEQVTPALAHVLEELAKHKEVIDEFSQAEVTAPEGKAELQTALGRAYLATANINAARTAFASALAAKPDYAPAQLGAARAAGAARDYNKALSLLESMPNSSEASYLKGEIYLAQGQQDAAVNAYRKSSELQRDFIPAHFALVTLQLRQGKLQDAAKQLEVMKQVAPKNPQTLYLQSLLAYQSRNPAAARDSAQQLLNVAPNYLPGLALAGAIEYELKSYSAAENYLTKALQRAPDYWPSRAMLVRTYLRKGEPDKALSTLKPALGKMDNDASMLTVAGETYMLTGDPAQASTYFAKAAALDPKNGGNRAGLAASLMARGDTERGLRELERAAAEEKGSRAELMLIATQMQRREYDKALKTVAEFEKKQPDSPAPHTIRGGILLTKKDLVGARRSFERALELNPAYFPAIDNLVRLDVIENKRDVARRRLEALLAKQPNHRDALLTLANLDATESGNKTSPEVVSLINKAIASDPNEALPRRLLISYFLRTNDTKQAIAAAQQALAAIPDQPEILEAAGAAYQAAGDTNQALALYSKLASLMPNSALPHIRAAQVYVAINDRDRAAAELQKVLTVQPNHLGAQRGLITLYVANGHNKEALATAQDVIRQRPKEAAGYILEGDVYAANKEWTEAAGAYRHGLKEVPSAHLAARLYDALRLGGNMTGATQFATSWLAEHPKDATFRSQLANTAMAQKDYGFAAQQYRKLLEQIPNNGLLLNNLAWASAQLKDPRAIEYAEQAHKLMPENPAILDTLGTLLVAQGDTARGLDILRKAAALAPQNPEFRLSLAKAQIKAGQKDAARKELDDLAKLGEKFAKQAEVTRLKQAL